MIIPIRCFTCGKVLANKWLAYQQAVKELEDKEKQKKSDDNDTLGDLAHNFDPVLKGPILDKLCVDRICCRRHLLGHVDLIDII